MADAYTKSLLDYYSHLNGLPVNNPQYVDPSAKEAQEKYEKYISALDSNSLSSDVKTAIANLLAQYGKTDWGWAHTEDCQKVELMAFYDENMNPGSELWSDARSCNGFTAAFFAACGIKTFDNSDGWNPHSHDCTAIVNVFSAVSNLLSGQMSDDDFHFTLGNLPSAEEQEKLVATRCKAAPILGFCNAMNAMINQMISYCQKAGLGSGDDPCWNICRQWEANDDRYPGHWKTEGWGRFTHRVYITDDPSKQNDPFIYKANESGYADASWSKDELQRRRETNYKQSFSVNTEDGSFDLTSAEFSSYLMTNLADIQNFFQ